MKASEVYAGSDGEVTKAYYKALLEQGAMGVIAVNLFRAQKCSSRAKKYRGGIRGKGSYKSMAYDRKSWSMGELCKALDRHADMGITYGWKQDPDVVFGNVPSWVLYVDLPQGQVSFHSLARGDGPDYLGEWDGCVASEGRILAFCDMVSRAGARERTLALPGSFRLPSASE